MKLQDLENQKIWEYFESISNIPRPSKKEEKIVDYIVAFAQQHNLKYKKDNLGNIIIFKQASEGFGDRKKTILQSHVDMVCEKATKSMHNFETDPIEIIQDGDWIKAHGTTLGADNGIGVAMQLAILVSNEIKHGPLACLFTVDEETGLTGAKNLSKEFLDADLLINLDSENDQEICIGCAGGVDTLAEFKPKFRLTGEKDSSFKITIDKLLGGHSGDEIHKGRCNSIVLMARLIKYICDKLKIRISKINGGKVRNAIPVYAECVITTSLKNEKKIKLLIDEFVKIVKDEYKTSDPNIQINIAKTDIANKSLTSKSQQKLIDSIYVCPNGVICWSQDIEGLVETSSNLATIKTEKNKIIIGTSQRSSVDSAKEDISQKIKTVFEMVGAKVTASDGYPGWKPNPGSELVKKASGIFKRLNKKEPDIIAIHAGLECGLFLDKNPNLDMISIGPLMLDVHTPNERLSISSTTRVWNWLVALLGEV